MSVLGRVWYIYTPCKDSGCVFEGKLTSSNSTSRQRHPRREATKDEVIVLMLAGKVWP